MGKLDFKYKGRGISGFDPSRTFVYPTSKARSKSGTRISKLESVGIRETGEVLTIMSKKVIPIIAARALAIIAVDLLSKAQPRVPYDIGFLRASGLATLKTGRATRIVGVGKSDGTVDSWVGDINKSQLVGVRTLRADVSYHRIGDKGEDVALWTHEQLWPFEARPRKPAAKQPGTGPKYLEIPWLENVGNYISFLESDLGGEGFENTIVLISRIKQKRMGRYLIKDFVDIVPEQIAFEGYFPPQLGYRRVGRRATKWKATKQKR